MTSADSDGPLRTLAADVIVTNSSLGAAGDGPSTADGTSMASAVAEPSLSAAGAISGVAFASGGLETSLHARPHMCDHQFSTRGELDGGLTGWTREGSSALLVLA